ncbi:hypothetical protein [Streptomyces sp. NPDC002088]|uniref:hypothetical protein n=1 Tax=Streptomyces sp. NPDC002088 TaxID=3154665 RepID=UPI003323D055
MDEEELEIEQGVIVFDTVNEVVAEIMEVGGQKVALRRPNGGVEWWRDKNYLRAPTTSERLSSGVAVANARSRGEL